MKTGTRSRVSTPDLILELRRIQEEHGYLPQSILREAADRLATPMSHVYGVATFFDEFSLERRGRHNVCVCRGSACGVKGGKDIISAAGEVLGVEPGQTTPDFEYTLETVSCFGNCAVAPAMLVDKELYGDLTPERVRSLLDSDLENQDQGESDD